MTQARQHFRVCSATLLRSPCYVRLSLQTRDCRQRRMSICTFSNMTTSFQFSHQVLSRMHNIKVKCSLHDLICFHVSPSLKGQLQSNISCKLKRLAGGLESSPSPSAAIHSRLSPPPRRSTQPFPAHPRLVILPPCLTSCSEWNRVS